MSHGSELRMGVMKMSHKDESQNGVVKVSREDESQRGGVVKIEIFGCICNRYPEGSKKLIKNILQV